MQRKSARELLSHLQSFFPDSDKWEMFVAFISKNFTPKWDFRFEHGQIIYHKSTGQPGIVLCSSTDGMVNVRFFKDGGDMFSQWVFEFEITSEKPAENQIGLKA